MAKKKKKTNGKARQEARINEQNRINKIIRQQAAEAGIIFNKNLTAAVDPKSGVRMTEETLKAMQAHANNQVAAGVALSTEYLNRLDLIDITDCQLIRKINTDEGLIQAEEELSRFLFPKETEFYRCLPCLSEAVIKCEGELLIYFKMLHIDTENQTARALVQRYDTSVRERNDVKPTDQMALYDSCEIGIYRDQTEHIHCHMESNKSIYDIYALLPEEKEILPPLQQHLLKLCRQRFKDDPMELDLATIRFEIYTQMINYTIEQSRLSKPDGEQDEGNIETPAETTTETPAENPTAKPGKSKTSTQDDKPDKTPPAVITHVYNGLRIVCKQSRKLRRLGPRNYITPSWTAKGHIRRYKSGKVVYIKPTIRHRKSLKNQDGTVPQNIIKIQ